MKFTAPISIIILGILINSCGDAVNGTESTPHEFAGEPTYQNPVIKGFNPDPSICRVGDDYFLVTSSFEYFPGVPLYHSTDLVNWTQIGNVLDRDSQLDLEGVAPSGGIFAPTLRYHDGTFYMITTNVSRGQNILVITDDPFGKWSDPVVIQKQNIDPSLFFDDDGKVYYTGTSPWEENSAPGIYQAEVDLKTGELLTEYKLIWEGTGGRYPEGPHLYKIGDMYYLMISEGGTEMGHFVTMARSDNPWGPFEECPHNPILTNRNEPFNNPVQNSGHADLVQDPDGKWWMVHLAVRNVNKHHHLGRETFLLPVDWNEEGWPVINRDGVSHIDVFAKTGTTQVPSRMNSYDFAEKPGPEWTHLRNPDRDNYRHDTSEQVMILTGTVLTLDDLANPTFMGIRQEDLEMTCTVKFNPGLAADGQEAGLTAYMNNEHYYAVSTRQVSGKKYVILTMKLGTMKHVEEMVPYNGGIVWLSIKGDPESYTFSWSADGKEFTELGSNYTRLISTETAGGFTGVFLGMYATSNGTKQEPTARFQNFSYISE